MAGTTTSKTDGTVRESVQRQAIIEHQKVIDDLEVLRAGLAALAAKHNALLTKLDADAGVTDTNYAATQAVTVTTYDAAGDLTAAKIADQRGTVITE